MKKIIVVLITIILICLPNDVSAKKGCCSHHGGVAGCNSNGRQVCNDGTLSPTCTCAPTKSYTKSYIYGCTDKSAKNYNSKANKNDGSCVYYKYGCIDKTANNYDSTAEKDDGSCIYDVYGCMDKTAKNYSEGANKDDGSCEYEIVTTDNEVNNESEEIKKSNKQNNDDSNISNNTAGGILGIGYLVGVVIAVFKGVTKRKH